MNNEELKEALLNERPVVYVDPLLGEINYKRVAAIIFEKRRGKIMITAKLEDVCGHSFLNCLPKAIRFKE